MVIITRVRDEEPDDVEHIPGNVQKNFRCPKEQFAFRMKELMDVLPKRPSWSISVDSIDEKGVLTLSILPSTAHRLGKKFEKILGPEIG